MMTKKIYYSLFAGLFLMSGCTDWDDHYVDGVPSGEEGMSIWEKLKSDDRLSDFCEVLEQTKVYRMHKKTPVSYADVLKGGQSFTVLAPLNNTFNKDSLLSLVQTVAGDSSVEKSFVQNHLSRKLISVNSDSVRMMMLNQKRLVVDGGKVGGVSVLDANNHSSNGMIHVLDRAVNYNRNIYEMLCDHPEFQEIGKAISRFNEDVFSPEASVSNGVVEGVPVYIDSVVYERNRLIWEIGELTEEDSVYWAVAPSAESWKKAYEKASQYFVFDNTYAERRDSLQRFYTMRALMQDAVFNMTDQKSTKDSLVSIPYVSNSRITPKGKHMYNVFYKPFEKDGILYNSTPIACSNGTIYHTEEWPFTPEQTYFKELFSEAENVDLIVDYDKERTVYNKEIVVADSVSEGGYLVIRPMKSTDNWSATFQVKGTLSGNYDIYAVILPKSVLPTNANPDMRPCKFKANINYLDIEGKAQSYACKSPDGKTEFENNPEHIDTVLIAENFNFPVYNYGESSKFSVKLSCSITARQTATYNREMYLDCIYLKPRTSKSEEE